MFENGTHGKGNVLDVIIFNGNKRIRVNTLIKIK